MRGLPKEVIRCAFRVSQSTLPIFADCFWWLNLRHCGRSRLAALGRTGEAPVPTRLYDLKFCWKQPKTYREAGKALP